MRNEYAVKKIPAAKTTMAISERGVSWSGLTELGSPGVLQEMNA